LRIGSLPILPLTIYQATFDAAADVVAALPAFTESGAAGVVGIGPKKSTIVVYGGKAKAGFMLDCDGKNPVIGVGAIPLGFALDTGSSNPVNLLDGLEVWWGCHESSGVDRADSSGHSRTLTQPGSSVPAVSGLIGNAAGFSTSTYLYSSWPVWFSGPWSISVWYQVTTPGFDVGMFGGSASAFQVLYTSGGDAIAIGLAGGGDTIAPTAGTWEHVAATYDGNTFKYFRGGVLQSSSVGVTFSSDLTDTNVGANPGASLFMAGAMQLIGVWSRGLTDGEVAALYNAGSGLDYPF
jgi:hypothetical protein